eukprot:GHVN01023679.1.p1 GENE.GHVN01023679.1~~GHVN01023679.1.p1  ORF type:complete len:657 (-),score=66.71 GHVN01023679.1:842-2812(-)
MALEDVMMRFLQDFTSTSTPPPWADWVYPHSGYTWVKNEWFQTFWYLLPLIILLIISLVGLKSFVTLPIAAVIMYFVRLIIFNADPNVCHWAIVNGFLSAWQPIVIVYGAIVMFDIMDRTGCMEWMIHQIKNISKGNPVAEIMLIPYAFGYIIEGAAGFGTPAALSAPVLRQLGHSEMLSIVLSLCMNSFPVCLAAVGTPIWFGLSGVQGADEAMYMVVANKASFIMMLSSFIIPPFILMIALPWRYVLKNLIFITLSSVSCTTCGYLFTLGGLSGSSTYEFGSLVGGCLGFFVTAGLTYFGVGLSEYQPMRDYPKSELAQQMAARRRDEGEVVIELSGDKASLLHPETTEHPGAGSPDTAAVDSFSERDDHTLNVQPIHLVARHCLIAHIITAHDLSDSPHMATSDAEHNAPPPNDDDADMERIAKQIESIDPIPSMVSNTQEKKTTILSEEELKFSWVGLLTFTFPFYITVFVLVLTRVKEIGIKGLLQSTTPTARVPLNGLGIFMFSPALVLQLMDTFGIQGGTVFETFYIPFILPFIIAGLCTAAIHWKRLPTGKKWSSLGGIFSNTLRRCAWPFVALIGANIFSLLLRKESGQFDAPTTVLGGTLAGGLGLAWIPISPILGMIGAFFSGSATVSGLTFGDIQRVAAETLVR